MASKAPKDSKADSTDAPLIDLNEASVKKLLSRLPPKLLAAPPRTYILA